MNFHSKNIIDFENRVPFFGQIFLEFLNFWLEGAFSEFEKDQPQIWATSRWTLTMGHKKTTSQRKTDI